MLIAEEEVADLSEQNLLAAFRDLAAAQHCQDALREQHFDVVEVSHLDSTQSPDILPHAPLVQWGRYGYQARRLDDRWTSPASWTGVTPGVDDGGAWLLTAVVPAEDAQCAARIIKEYGGSL
jgi:hypothetical protein